MSDGAFGTVLVPVEFESLEALDDGANAASEANDGSSAIGPYTAHALELAARLARGGDLWLVHAHHPFSDYATWLNPKNLADLEAAARRHATMMLSAAAARHCSGVRLHHVVEAGSPLDVILEVAEEHPPDAIVLATSSRGRVNRAFHGSTADKLIRRASCPVLVVPTGTP